MFLGLSVPGMEFWTSGINSSNYFRGNVLEVFNSNLSHIIGFSKFFIG